MNALRHLGRGRPAALMAVALVTIATPALFSADGEFRPDYRPAAYAIAGAKVVPSPGQVIENGTVVVRDGVIEAVGKAEEVAIPADAETIEGKGLVVYPGFLDMYTTLGTPSGTQRSLTGPGRTIPYADFALARTPTDNRTGITPEFAVGSVLEMPDATVEERRKLGFTDLVAAPGGSIAAGQSAVVSLSGLPRREALLKTPLALHILLANPAGFSFSESRACEDEVVLFDEFRADGTPPTAPAPPAEDPIEARRRAMRAAGYPISLMGVIAHLRQAMLDADYQQKQEAYYAKDGGNRPAHDPSLDALAAARSKKLSVWWEANTRDEIHRVLDLAAEFGTDATIVGGREAAKVADRLKAQEIPVVLRLDFPEEPKVPSEADFRKKNAEGRDTPLKVLQERENRWKERVATASALHKAGVKFAFGSDGLAKSDTFHSQVRKLIAAGLPADAAVEALTRSAAEIAGLGGKLGTIEKGKLGHLVVMTAPYGDEKAKPRYVLADGMKFDLEKTSAATAKKGGEGRGDASKKGDPTSPPKNEEDQATKPESNKVKADPTKASPPGPKPEPGKADAPAPAPAPGPAPAPKAADGAPAHSPKAAEPAPGPFVDVPSEFEADRYPKLRTGGNVLIKDATILTVSRAGTIAKGSILVRNGKIEAIGADLAAPEGFQVLDANGLVAMPGIIDTHSHMAIQGGVNEGTLSIVPEVRVADVVDGEDPTIYRALAGGTTSARLLHGSANTIGGQDVVVKLRYGLPARDLILRDEKRPQGVKFALGENVTRRTNRFPYSRMGVEATIERAFLEGRAYAAEKKAHDEAEAAGKAVAPFRRDLRLEALAAIVDGSIKIHSHCYRSDEILMLLRTCERFGVRVQSLQHVLEGYKVAAEIAAHGASASTFSDWWAYKIEAYDAIPFNAALLTEAGARVCIKSDSEELVRHLYLEAAKMVKYGAVTEGQALEMITLNPARELGLEHRLGTIEVGKDADIALFNAHPFDTFARCQISLVDGEVRFLRKEADGKFAPRPGDKGMPGPDLAVRTRPLDIPANAKNLYALTGATIHPVSGADVPNGTIVVADGKIAAIGGSDTPVPAGTTTIDARGLDVWPGMVDAGSVVGLFEIGSLPETLDASDSAQSQPEVRTSVAIHPDSELIPVTRANGVLSAYIQPGGGGGQGPNGGLIPGQGCIADLSGWVPSEMVLVDGAALNVNIPNYIPPDPEGGRRGRFGGGAGGDDPNSRRKERLDAIRDAFQTAVAYDKVVSAAKAGKAAMPAPDPRNAALAPFARGKSW